MDPEETSPSLKIVCPKCRTIYPVGVTMDDRGEILDDPIDFADFWAHTWTHEAGLV